MPDIAVRNPTRSGYGRSGTNKFDELVEETPVLGGHGLPRASPRRRTLRVGGIAACATIQAWSAHRRQNAARMPGCDPL